MGKKLRDIVVIFGPYLYFLGVIFIFLNQIVVGIVVTVIGALCALFARIYCIYHDVKNRNELKDIWILHLILLLMIGKMYIPIYYVYCVMKKNIVFGIIAALVYPILVVGLFITAIISGITGSTNSNYRIFDTKDNIVSISLPKGYACSTNSENYSLECTDYNKNFVGLINLTSEDEEEHDYDYYYSKIINYYQDKYSVYNLSESSSYASFEFMKNGKSYIAVVEEKYLDVDTSTILVYVSRKRDYYNYTKVYSSIGLAIIPDIA